MCNFQKLAFSEYGYVVRCLDCGHYQLGFGTTMLTLNNADFRALYEMVAMRLNTVSVTKYEGVCEESKSIFIATSSPACCLVLTKHELQSLYEILDKADNELTALSMLQLFK